MGGGNLFRHGDPPGWGGATDAACGTSDQSSAVGRVEGATASCRGHALTLDGILGSIRPLSLESLLAWPNPSPAFWRCSTSFRPAAPAPCTSSLTGWVSTSGRSGATSAT